MANGWMTNIVNASQQLLSKQFPHLQGLQSVTLGRTLSFNIQWDKFVHIQAKGTGSKSPLSATSLVKITRSTAWITCYTMILCTIDVQMQEERFRLWSIRYFICYHFGKWKAIRRMLFWARHNEGSFDATSTGAKDDNIPTLKEKMHCNEEQECNQPSYLM